MEIKNGSVISWMDERGEKSTAILLEVVKDLFLPIWSDLPQNITINSFIKQLDRGDYICKEDMATFSPQSWIEDASFQGVILYLDSKESYDACRMIFPNFDNRVKGYEKYLTPRGSNI